MRYESKVKSKNYKTEIKSIFEIYSGRDGYINYYHAIDLCKDLIEYLERVTDALIENQENEAAFDISKYVYIELGKRNIDDEVEIGVVFDQCHEIWRRILSLSTSAERARIKEAMTRDLEQENVKDDLRKNFEEFLRYELTEPEALEAEIADLDRVIENGKDKTGCPKVFLSIYGYNMKVIDFRNILRRKLRLSEDETLVARYM